MSSELYLGDESVTPIITKIISENLNGHFIGEYIQVNCTADYTPYGCLACDGAEYESTVFPDFWANYLINALVNTCSYAEYDILVTEYGQCSKFALDSDAGTFKTPTIKDGAVITQAQSDGELGKAYNQSLPNITGKFGMVGSGSDVGWNTGVSDTGAFSRLDGIGDGGATSANGNGGVSFDASNSSSVYQDGADVKMDQVTARVFVVVANGEINKSMIDWSQYTKLVQLKADKNMANVSQVGRNTAILWGIPDYASGTVLDIATTSYTPLSHGYLYAEAGPNMAVAFRDEATNTRFAYTDTYTGQGVSIGAFVSKDVPILINVVDGDLLTLVFFPLQGAQ